MPSRLRSSRRCSMSAIRPSACGRGLPAFGGLARRAGRLTYGWRGCGCSVPVGGTTGGGTPAARRGRRAAVGLGVPGRRRSWTVVSVSSSRRPLVSALKMRSERPSERDGLGQPLGPEQHHDHEHDQDELPATGQVHGRAPSTWTTASSVRRVRLRRAAGPRARRGAGGWTPARRSGCGARRAGRRPARRERVGRRPDGLAGAGATVRDSALTLRHRRSTSTPSSGEREQGEQRGRAGSSARGQASPDAGRAARSGADGRPGGGGEQVGRAELQREVEQVVVGQAAGRP